MKIDDSIYLDYQASTPVDRQVRLAMQKCSETNFANPHSTQHLLGQESASVVDNARKHIESLIGAKNEEVIFTSGATEANNHAIASVLFDNVGGTKKTILISTIEHKCVKNAAYFYATKLGFNVKEIPVLASGVINLDAYQSMLNEEVVIVCIMAVNNEIGVIQNVKPLAEMAHRVGALFHCDAAQAPLAVDINVQDWQVDTLSLSGHKIYGPKGIGVLYMKNSVQAHLPPFIHGGGQQGGARSGTVPTELCVGMAEGLALTNTNAAQQRERLAKLKETFITELSNSGLNFLLNGDQQNCHPGNINVRFDGLDAAALIKKFQPFISASTGSACNSEMLLPSHVLKAIGLTDEEAVSSIRFSIGRYTDEKQITEAVNIIRSCERSE